MGYGEGKAFLYRRKEYLLSTAARTVAEGDAAVELMRLDRARQAARRELEALAHNLSDRYKLDEAHIFHAHFLILEDPMFGDLVRGRIDKGRSAEMAVAETVHELEEQFKRQENPYLRERSVDVHDVGTRLLSHLVDRRHHPFSALPEGSVLIADELLPSDTVYLERNRVRAIVTAEGSDSSHAAILARAFGIPAVSGIAKLLDLCRDGESVAVDGESGKVFFDIEGGVGAEYARRARGYRLAVEEIQSRSHDTLCTVDGEQVRIEANVAGSADVDLAVRRDASGIGLLRTEFLYLTEGGIAPAEVQEEWYRDVLRRMDGRPVTVRIVDIAPDKAMPLSGDSPIASAALPDCGIHYALQHPEILAPQLRALLRVADEGELRILLPGVTGVGEIERFRLTLAQSAADLGDAVGRDWRAIPIGAMVETPSAIFMLRDIADAVDFLSLGTNDLLCHLFGRERRKATESMCEPSLLRAVDQAVRAAAERGRDIGICGELAGEPAFTALLLGIGIRRFSMSPERIPEVRYNFSRLHAGDAAALAAEVLAARSADAVERILEQGSHPWADLLRRYEAEESN